MWEKGTGDLEEELMSTDSIDSYIHDNEGYFFERSITEALEELYERKSVSKALLARQSGMSEVYLHQVFSGRRNPSRDRLLCLCICMGASLEEIQQTLKHATYAPLYPKHKRDAIISHGILHGTALEKINEKLAQEQEQPLF